MLNKEHLEFSLLDKVIGRRGMIGTSILGFAGLAVWSRGAWSAGRTGRENSTSTDESTSIHQVIDLKASPERVYEALLDSKQFSTFTGAAAEIHREPGGAFSCFDGQIIGRNVELVPSQRIVQAWRSAGWPAGDYSIVKFELNKQSFGTRLIMDHRGFPDGKREQLEAGWKSHYWEPLPKYLT